MLQDSFVARDARALTFTRFSTRFSQRSERQMKTRQDSALDISPQQAHYVLGKLISHRRVSVRDVQKYLAALGDKLRSLEARLEALRGSEKFYGASPGSRANGGSSRRNISSSHRALLNKQGVYMALLRQLPKSRRAEFKSVRAERGIDRALSALRDAVNAG